MNKKTLAINLYGGPGTGKSTMAAAIFAELKFRDFNVEVVQEFAKDLVWENRMATFSDELYVFAKQAHRVQRLNEKVEIIISDSPLIMKLNYLKPEEVNFRNLVIEEFNKYNNVNIFLKRIKLYNPNGRYQTEEEAKQLDTNIKHILEDNNIEHHVFDSLKESVNKIIELIELELKKQ